MKNIELLAPAGDLEKLKVAILYGANAVFIGGQQYGLRANAANFSIADIKAGCEFAHEHNAKIYVTTNIYFHNNNLQGFIKYIQELEKCGVDGLITADLCAIKMISVHTNLEVHLSTQASVLNRYALKFYEQLGVTRIVLAREAHKDEIKALQAFNDLELEVFIHGSMCIGYSGRCMLSNHMTARDANRGGCSQNCRWEYELLGDNISVSNQYGLFSMNPHDLTLVDNLGELKDLAIASLKIEGRMRSIYYIANVVGTYRYLLDNDVADTTDSYHNLLKSANRKISSQYFDNIPKYSKQTYQTRDEVPNKDFCCLVKERVGEYVLVEQRNYFKVNDTLEFIRPHLEPVALQVSEIYDEDFNLIDVARHPQQKLYIKTDLDLFSYCMGRLVLTTN